MMATTTSSSINVKAAREPFRPLDSPIKRLHQSDLIELIRYDTLVPEFLQPETPKPQQFRNVSHCSPLG